jgi:hypothetical protein
VPYALPDVSFLIVLLRCVQLIGFLDGESALHLLSPSKNVLVPTRLDFPYGQLFHKVLSIDIWGVLACTWKRYPFSPIIGISLCFFPVVTDFVGLIVGGHISYLLQLREESELGLLIPGVLLEQSCCPISNFPKTMLLYDMLIVVS